jgi:hypothetical protein
MTAREWESDGEKPWIDLLVGSDSICIDDFLECIGEFVGSMISKVELAGFNLVKKYGGSSSF